MIIPAFIAFLERDYFVARTFLYCSCAGVIVYTLIAIALSNIIKVQNNFEKLLSCSDFKIKVDPIIAITII